MNGRDFLEDSGDDNLEELRQIAYRDFLTGIPNRRFFMENLSARLKRMAGSGAFLLVGIIDLNGFKAVNDLYGHKIGDRILVEVASRLSALMDPADLMARFGGDEFAFVFSRFDRIREVRERIEEILSELARPSVKRDMCHLKQGSSGSGERVRATLSPQAGGREEPVPEGLHEGA